jgi:hypothetical protein
MTKPVAVFYSRVIGDSRHTVRFDENSHLVLFPSFSRYITSWAISATWPVEASGLHWLLAHEVVCRLKEVKEALEQSQQSRQLVVDGPENDIDNLGMFALMNGKAVNRRADIILCPRLNI